jgi:threonine/homoserine/homoserine lactone efflux protein
MPDFATLAAFSLTALALVVSPGPDTMLILHYGLTSERRAALAAVAGVQAGLAVHTLLAIAGISALIAASPTLFRGLAVAGAAYLGWLGIQGLRGAAEWAAVGARLPASVEAAWRTAVLTNVPNPKVILLFVALYPNFIEPGRGNVPGQLLSLSAVLLVINVMWQTSLAWAASRVRRWLGNPRVQLLVSRLTGVILLAFAVLILWQHVA